MAHSYHHAVSSARRYGGSPDDYLALHAFMDSSKAAWADQRHRAVLHHSFGIYLAEQVFGLQEEVRILRALLARIPRWLQRLLGLRIPSMTPVTITASSGKQVPIRLLAEQHIVEDCGFIPTVEQYLGELPRKPWMSRGAAKLSRILETEQSLPSVLAPEASESSTEPSGLTLSS